MSNHDVQMLHGKRCTLRLRGKVAPCLSAFTIHLQHGAIMQHYAQKQNEPVARNIIVNNTKVLSSELDSNRLQIFESLCTYMQKSYH